MKHFFFAFLFALGCVEVCSGQYYYDRIVPLKDAPFSAEVHESYKYPNSSSSWTVEIARAGDGSLYEAKFESEGEFKGSMRQISITDASNHCRVGIGPYRSGFTRTDHGERVKSWSGMTIGLAADQTSASPTPTIQDIRDKNLREQQRISNCLQCCKPDAPLRQTSLGQRTSEGMTIFGFHTEHRLDSGTDRIEERWESELGFTYSFKLIHPIDGTIDVWGLTGLKLAEPPAELFAAQDKYFPPSRVLPSARTIFISGPIGDAGLTDQIKSILTASGRFTVVADRNTADLVVSTLHENTGDKADPSLRSIRLQFSEQNGSSLFWITLNLHGATKQWAQSRVINTCFANVWKSVESFQVPVALSP